LNCHGANHIKCDSEISNYITKDCPHLLFERLLCAPKSYHFSDKSVKRWALFLYWKLELWQWC